MSAEEELAYEMYLADWKEKHNTEEPLSWNKLTEEQRAMYLRHACAACEYFLSASGL